MLRSLILFFAFSATAFGGDVFKSNTSMFYGVNKNSVKQLNFAASGTKSIEIFVRAADLEAWDGAVWMLSSNGEALYIGHTFTKAGVYEVQVAVMAAGKLAKEMVSIRVGDSVAASNSDWQSVYSANFDQDAYEAKKASEAVEREKYKIRKAKEDAEKQARMERVRQRIEERKEREAAERERRRQARLEALRLHYEHLEAERRAKEERRYRNRYSCGTRYYYGHNGRRIIIHNHHKDHKKTHASGHGKKSGHGKHHKENK